MSVRAVVGSKPARAAIEADGFGLDWDFAEMSPVHKAFPDVVAGRYDVAELALVTFLQAFDAGRPLCLLPVTLLGRFQHHCLVALDGGATTVGDLAGKRIGVRSWAQTTGVWVRGIFADDHGLDVDATEWVVYEGGHLAGAEDPPYVTRAPEGASLTGDYLGGAVDAAILGNQLPDDPRVRTVLTDPAREAATWFGRTGAVPLNHLLVASEEFLGAHADVVARLCTTVSEAVTTVPRISSTPNTTPAGFDAIADAIDLAGRYAHAQGVTGRAVTADEVRTRTEQVIGLDLGRLVPATTG